MDKMNKSVVGGGEQFSSYGRVGSVPVSLKGVQVFFDGFEVLIKGPAGENKFLIDRDVIIKIGDNFLSYGTPCKNIAGDSAVVGVTSDLFLAKNGTYARLLKWSVAGVLVPFKNEFKIVGIGYKVEGKGEIKGGEKVTFKLGYTLPRILEVPQGVVLKVDSMVKFSISSSNKQTLGDFRAKICKLRKYNPYNGAGILWVEAEKSYKRKEAKK